MIALDYTHQAPPPLVRHAAGTSWIGTPRKPAGCRREVQRLYDKHGRLAYVMTTDFCTTTAPDPGEL